MARPDILVQFRGEKFRLGELTIDEIDVIERTFGIPWPRIRPLCASSPRAAQAVLGVAALRQGLTGDEVAASVADLTLEQLEDAFSATDADEPAEAEPDDDGTGTDDATPLSGGSAPTGSDGPPSPSAGPRKSPGTPASTT